MVLFAPAVVVAVGAPVDAVCGEVVAEESGAGASTLC
jgi:hypothetical protein